MATATRASDGLSREDKRRRHYRQHIQGRQNPSQSQDHNPRQEAAETNPNQRLNVPTAQRGRLSRGRGGGRGRGGSFAHGPSASRSGQSHQGRHFTNALPISLMQGPIETIEQTETQTSYVTEGIRHTQWETRTIHSMNGSPVCAETSSILTRTESTGWSSMDYSSTMEVHTPASEPPDPWPHSPGGHNYMGTGAQFAPESEGLLAQIESNDATTIQNKSLAAACICPVIVVTSDGKADFIDPGAEQNEVDTGEDEAGEDDLLSSIPLNMSRAHLDWVQLESWLETLPKRIPRVSTFPTMGIAPAGEESVSYRTRSIFMMFIH